MAETEQTTETNEGWKEAAIAWAVCASIHREYCKGKDPFFKTRQADFAKHEDAARTAYLKTQPRSPNEEPTDRKLAAALHEVAVYGLGGTSDVNKKVVLQAAQRSARLTAALKRIANEEPPKEEIEQGTVSAWLRKVARSALSEK